MNITTHGSAAWPEQVAGRLLARLGENPRLVLCLPTGNTPRPVYAHLAAGISAGQATLAEATIFVLDEFGELPPDDPARCASMVARDLLEHVDAQPARVHLPHVDGPDLPAACRAYDQAIAGAGGLDLALLGLGGNGHVGMNEPGTDPTSRTHVATLHPTTRDHASDYGATVTPMWGVTIGIATLLEAAELWLLVSGGHKRQILADVIEGPVGPHLPASLLRVHPRFEVLADDSATQAPANGL